MTAPASVAPASTAAPAPPPVAAGRAAGTSTAPTGRSLWQGGRGPLLVVVVLVLASVVFAALRATGPKGVLDPRAYTPQGSRALAALLADRGVSVHLTGDLPSLRAAANPRSTVLVPLPGQLTTEELHELAALALPLVVTGAGPEALDGLGLQVTASPAGLAVRTPGCELPAARVAGAALTGRVAYEPAPGVDAGAATGAVAPDTGVTGCYAADGRATVLALPTRRTVLVGAPDLLTNDALDREGNAALALGLLGAGGPAAGDTAAEPVDQVLWLLPKAGRALPAGQRSLRDLLPDAVGLGALQMLLAVVLLALWRARRLGRVVTEPLPVAVRAAEAVEGRGRLYRVARARDVAGEALRSAARERLARRLGLGPEASPQALTASVAQRLGRDPAEVFRLLYGPSPTDDTALVRLADDLDGLAP